jgi:hypothetical protein
MTTWSKKKHRFTWLAKCIKDFSMTEMSECDGKARLFKYYLKIKGLGEQEWALERERERKSLGEKEYVRSSWKVFFFVEKQPMHMCTSTFLGFIVFFFCNVYLKTWFWQCKCIDFKWRWTGWIGQKWLLSFVRFIDYYSYILMCHW